MRNKVFIAFIALIPRIFFAFIFFGSVDIRCFMSMTTCTLSGTLLDFPLWNYFPVLPHYLWFVGKMTLGGLLPFAFWCKTIPIIFDTLIALLVYDIVKLRQPGKELFAGLFYALCPVSIIIVAIHGQWEPLFLFFLLLSFFIRDYVVKSTSTYLLFGIIFGFSFLLKPASLIFLPFFFTPHEHLLKKLHGLRVPLLVTTGFGLLVLTGAFACIKWYKLSLVQLLSESNLSVKISLLVLPLVILAALTMLAVRVWPDFSASLRMYMYRQMTALVGLTTIVAGCFTLFYLYGFNLVHLCETILRYCNQGVQLMGLPFLPGIEGSVGALILKNRFILMSIVLMLAWQYYHRRIDVFTGIAITFAIIFGLSGICPQYLMWLVPLMLIRGHFAWCTVYTIIVTLFYVLFYSSPWGNPAMPYQNMLAFASLIDFAGLMPSMSYLDPALSPVIMIIGSLILPLFSCAYAFYSWRQAKLVYDTGLQLHDVRDHVPVFILLFPVIITLIAESCRWSMSVSECEAFSKLLAHPFAHYAVTFIGERPVADYPAHSFFINAPIMFVLLALLCTLGFFMYGRRQS